MFILIVLIVVIVLLYLLFWPVPVKPIKWTPPEAPELKGEYVVNQALAAVERLEVGGRGPEDVIFDQQGRLFTGLEDGRILRMSADGGDLEVLANTGGRPLGLAVDAGGNLIIADADKGLLSVDPQGQLKLLTNTFEGRKLVLTNHLDVAVDGTIYFSESSNRFPLHDYLGDIIESRPNGRLLAYDPEKDETRLVLDELYFANGVAISSDQSYLLVAETDRYRIRRLWLSGPRAGDVEMFIENLPGFADNLHNNGSDTFWLALTSPRKSIVDNLAGRPFIRKMIYRLPDFLIPSPDRYGFVLGLDGDGRVIHNFQDPSGSFSETSGATEYEGKLYVGTLSGEAIGRLNLR
jgi:sugar lactone lactonase YvrE